MRLFWQQPGVLFFTFWESGKEKPFTDLLIAAYPWVEFACFFSLNLYLLLNVSSKMKSYLFKNIFSILPCSSSSSREARDPSYLLQNVCAEYQLLRCSGSFGICIKKHCLKKKINRRLALFSFCLRALPINENVESTALGDAPRFKFILVMTAF